MQEQILNSFETPGPGLSTIRSVVSQLTPDPIPVNLPPIAGAGMDVTITLPVDAVILSGQASDPEGKAVTAAWSKVQGVAGVIESPNSVSTKVSGLAAGNYVFRLTVKDDQGAVTSDDVSILVKPVVVAPPTSSKVLSLVKKIAWDYAGGSGTVANPIIIENIEFGNAAGSLNGNVLRINGVSNIIIRNCRLTKGTGGDNGGGRGIYLYGCTNVTIQNCLFDNLRGGVLASACKGGIKVNANQFVNMQGPFPNGQYIQFNQCSGTGNEAQFNQGEDFLNESNPEDMVNLYGSSNVLVNGNVFRAGGAKSSSGGGIVAGDSGGSNNIISNNRLVSPGQYGVAIVGGDRNQLIGNMVYATYKEGNNVGLVVWDSAAGQHVTNATVKGNKVFYIKTDAGVHNDFWLDTASNFLVKEQPTSVTLAEMGVPDHLITMITPDELLKVRKKTI